MRMKTLWKMTLCLFPIVFFCVFIFGVVPKHNFARSLKSAAVEQVKRHCGRGEYYVVGDTGAVSCSGCPKGHFMDEDVHNNTECISCKTKDEHITYEIVIKNCTPESDIVLGCIDGYYVDWNRQCKLCTQCQHQKRTPYVGEPCTQLNNTVCCPYPNMKVVWSEGRHSFQCISGTTAANPATPPSHNCEGSVLRENGCHQGEYLVPQCQTDKWVTCKPCEVNTFLNLSRHNETSCLPCSPPTESDWGIVAHCTRKHDNIYETSSSTTDIVIGVSVAVVVLLVIAVPIIVYRCKRGKHQDIQGTGQELLASYSRPAHSDSDHNSDSDSFDRSVTFINQ